MTFRLLLLALPLAEIGVFILVGREIGVVATLLLTLGTALLGTALLRRQGLAAIQRIRAELSGGRLPARGLAEGAMIAVAGLLLIAPGFLTDTIGLALFVPALRRALWRQVASRLAAAGKRFPERRPAPGRVIELDQSDFASRPAPSSPWRGEAGPRRPD